MGEKQPKVLFLRSPVEILEKLHIWKKHNIEYKPINKIWKLITNLHDNIVETLEDKFGEYIDDDIYL